MVYKDSAGKEIHEGDSLMDLTPGFVGEISEVFLDEDEGELAVNQLRTVLYGCRITSMSIASWSHGCGSMERRQRNWWTPFSNG